MSTTPVPSPGTDSHIALARATPVVWRNNWLVCWVIRFIGLMAAFFGICMLILGLSYIFPLRQLTFGRGVSALIWISIAPSIASICPQFWRLGGVMRGYQVHLDQQGATFKLGTKAQPSDVFLPWDQIAAVQYRRDGNSKQFWVEAKDGGQVVWSYYTFFRPRKVAQLIADRIGLAIQKA